MKSCISALFRLCLQALSFPIALQLFKNKQRNSDTYIHEQLSIIYSYLVYMYQQQTPHIHFHCIVQLDRTSKGS